MNIKKYKKWKDKDTDIHYVPEEYFSGTSANIYINNKYLTDVSNITFSLRQNLKPIYGYKSYTFDAMAIGNRIIVGSFLIPFVRKNYLYNFFIMEEKKEEDKEVINEIGIATNKTLEYLDKRGLMQNEKIIENNTDRKNTHAYDSDSFSTEDKIRLQKHGFDISIMYEERTISEIAEVYKNNEFSDINSVDDVLLKGVETISGIHLRGHGKTISFNDTIYEQYEFIAKDII